jgi:microcystin-dependent protein
MANPFVGQIISVGFNFAPIGWFLCDGSPKPISEYQVLYTLLGTTYGGNGTTTFNVPDLRGRAPLGMGQGRGLSAYVQGTPVGTEQVSLTTNNTPLHNHTIAFSANNATDFKPAAGFTVGTNVQTLINGVYAAGPGTTPLRAGAISTNTSGGVPHENRQPFVVFNYIISWAGVFPSQN